MDTPPLPRERLFKSQSITMDPDVMERKYRKSADKLNKNDSFSREAAVRLSLEHHKMMTSRKKSLAIKTHFHGIVINGK